MSIFTRAFNKFGGYDEFSDRFPGATKSEGTRWDHQCVEFGGTMRYDWCTTLSVARSGLYVQARPPARGVQAAMFVPQPVWDAAGPLWQAAWQTGP